MAKYKIKQSLIDEINKEIVYSIIMYYTIRKGYIDLDKINPTTLVRRHGIKLDDAKRALQALISEGKVEVV